MFHLPVWARVIVLAAVIETGLATATWAQGPHMPGGLGGAMGGMAGAMGGAAEAAALAHYLQMLKHFDRNGNGMLDPSEVGMAKSGLGNLLGGNAGGNAGNLLPMFDRNGNGQLDTAEMQMAQMMMAMLIANYSRPVTGVPLVMPTQDPPLQTNPSSQPSKRGRRKRGERIADFAKANNPPGAPKAAAGGAKKKVKARAPMVERDQQGKKAAPAANAPAND